MGVAVCDAAPIPTLSDGLHLDATRAGPVTMGASGASVLRATPTAGKLGPLSVPLSSKADVPLSANARSGSVGGLVTPDPQAPLAAKL